MDPRIDVLISLLERHRADLARAYRAIPAARTATRTDDETWSVAEVLEHLAETERLVGDLLSRLLTEAQPRGPSEAFDPSEFERRVDMPVFLDRSRRLQGPQPPGTLSAGEAWTALGAVREELLARLAEARGCRLEEVSHPHPLTGKPLDGYQWIAFVALHEGRHAAQIRELATRLAGVPDPAEE